MTASIDEDLPTRYCLEVNAHCQARYAALAQEAGLVPIVEPETTMNGVHPIERSRPRSRELCSCRVARAISTPAPTSTR
jgi:fructose-bisphosphate aldolase, class I